MDWKPIALKAGNQTGKVSTGQNPGNGTETLDTVYILEVFVYGFNSIGIRQRTETDLVNLTAVTHTIVTNRIPHGLKLQCPNIYSTR